MISRDPETNRRVLIIDDNHTIHADFQKILCPSQKTAALDETEAELFGTLASPTLSAAFKVDSAMQGKEGLDRVQRAMKEGRPYAMAFIDVRMPPGRDGIETTARIWETYPDLQVVICTAYSDYSWDEMLANIGQSDRLVILKKPFDNIEVLQLANALTEKWRLLQQIRLQVSNLEDNVRERTQALQSANASLKAEIAERKKIEVQLRHVQNMESIGQLAAGIAREITPPTESIGDSTRFLKHAFTDLNTVLQRQDELVQAVKSGARTDRLLAAVECAARTADLERLGAKISQALQQTLDGVERVTRIVQVMTKFSHGGTEQITRRDLTQAIKAATTDTKAP